LLHNRPSIHRSMKTSITRKGFSLIETVIALGIMGLAVTALLGLLPHGMEMSKKAANAGAQSRIIDFVRAELSHFKLSALQSVRTAVRYQFDEEGMSIDQNDNASLVSYAVEVQPPNAQLLSLPGGSPEPYLLNFVVRVAATPLRTFDFANAAATRYTSVPLHIGPTVP